MPSLATNSGVVLSVTVRNTAGAVVDPTTIELHWKLGRHGDETTVPMGQLDHDSTGVFSATVNPRDPGNLIGKTILLRYEFRMTNPDYVERGKVAISTSEFCQ